MGNSRKNNDFTDSVQQYFRELKDKRYDPLSRDEESELIKKAKEGCMSSRDRILESNLRFVFDQAKKLTGRGVPICELIAEGNIGLIKALDKFDVTRDVRFISYAVWWVKQAMYEAIEKQYAIDSNTVEAETETELDADVEPRQGRIEQVESEDSCKKEKDTELVWKLLSTIGGKERDVIIKYYGLGEHKAKSLSEIGGEMDITSERVRQIKIDALMKLKAMSIYMDDAEQYL